MGLLSKLGDVVKLAKLLQGGLPWEKVPTYLLDQLVDFGTWLAKRWEVPLTSKQIIADVRWAWEQTLKHRSPE